MSIMKKLQQSGVAKKVMDEARKPENKAKAQDALRKIQAKRGARRPR
ncbi:hypothetical protein [Nocardioides litoris]|nr:hypothetical protein [Nocardioides litoris]